jgi:hypothetical protein
VPVPVHLREKQTKIRTTAAPYPILACDVDVPRVLKMVLNLSLRFEFMDIFINIYGILPSHTNILLTG